MEIRVDHDTGQVLVAWSARGPYWALDEAGQVSEVFTPRGVQVLWTGRPEASDPYLAGVDAAFTAAADAVKTAKPITRKAMTAAVKAAWDQWGQTTMRGVA